MPESQQPQHLEKVVLQGTSLHLVCEARFSRVSLPLPLPLLRSTFVGLPLPQYWLMLIGSFRAVVQALVQLGLGRRRRVMDQHYTRKHHNSQAPPHSPRRKRSSFAWRQHGACGRRVHDYHGRGRDILSSFRNRWNSNAATGNDQRKVQS
jgi:hypothetical protein